jgi:hypothetical protein
MDTLSFNEMLDIGGCTFCRTCCAWALAPPPRMVSAVCAAMRAPERVFLCHGQKKFCYGEGENGTLSKAVPAMLLIRSSARRL